MTAKKAAASPKHKTATAKHTATRKHTESAKTRSAAAKKAAATRKANKSKVTAKGKPATHAKAAKAVSFAVGDLLPVCGIEAVAMSLRLAGQPVHGDDVAELWHLLGERPEGVPVGEALAAAALSGLGSVGPGRVHPVQLPLFSAAMVRPGYRQVCGAVQAPQEPALDPVVDWPVLPALWDLAPWTGYPGGGDGAAILRIDVPGPHAVLATADGWWSWGQLYSPWPCRVEEAWAVSWS